MQRDEALERLRALKPRFAEMNIRRLALFGSTARDEAGPDSDIDLLVEMDVPAGLVTLSRKRRELESYLGLPVDLYPMRGVDPHRHSYIMKDWIDV